jgi:inosine triphosphate pyrophosphatase
MADNWFQRKWFLEQLGSSNLHRLLAGFDDKSAQITNTFAYSAGPGHDPVIFQGHLSVRHSRPTY